MAWSDKEIGFQSWSEDTRLGRHTQGIPATHLGIYECKGWFLISQRNVRFCPDILAKVFYELQFVPLRIDLDFHTDYLKYMGISPYFR